MIVDGRAIARHIKEGMMFELGKLDSAPTFCVLTALEGLDPAAKLSTETYLNVKQKYAESLNIPFERREFTSHDASKYTDDCGSIVVQLPLPVDFDTTSVLNSIPWDKDVDVLSFGATERFEKGTLPILPPVVGAFREVLEEHNISIEGRHVVVIGKGKLVGQPAAVWFERLGATVTQLGKSDNLKKHTLEADIIVLGAGVPGLLAEDMVNEHAAVLDAGTSEAGGMLAGDADPLVGKKVALFTPVPGGIGPITIATLFENHVKLAALREGNL